MIQRSARGSAALRDLADLYGVQTSYRDSSGRTRRSPPEAVLAALRALGAAVESPGGLHTALAERRAEVWSRPLPRVAVAWEGKARVRVRLPASGGPDRLDCTLHQEDGQSHTWRVAVDSMPSLDGRDVETAEYVVKGLSVPIPVPFGYHRLEVAFSGSRRGRSLLISAPSRAYCPPQWDEGKGWGVFLPLYALRTGRDWGAGDFTDLAAMAEWASGLGASCVAILPLLASFLDRPFDPSPYAPASRLFWNELYVDVTRAPGLEDCPEARDLIASPAVREEIEQLRSGELVDYRRLATLKHSVLSLIARSFAERGRERLEAFAQEHPEVADYAAFRAAGERTGAPWRRWPEAMRDGSISEADYDSEARDYHVYVQLAARNQLESLKDSAQAKGVSLYFDLPLGVHAESYDVWRERESFAEGVSGGAPPDAFFTGGQDWGFPPLQPEAMRKQGYRYLIAALRNMMSHCSVLRIDHVMALHRLYWVPKGMSARDGVYVRYPADEMYAILCLESHRAKTLVVGEDLGTVPSYVPRAMKEHNIQRTFVLQFNVSPQTEELPQPGRSSVATVNTHDMPPFAAFWHGRDIDDREELGLLGSQEAERERKSRRRLRERAARLLRGAGLLEADGEDARAVLGAFLSLLAASRSRLMLVNLEDLWLEEQPQNVPGTDSERPNWRRRGRLALKEFASLPELTETLSEIDRLRKGEENAGA